MHYSQLLKSVAATAAVEQTDQVVPLRPPAVPQIDAPRWLNNLSRQYPQANCSTTALKTTLPTRLLY